jgi:hypothetical protein
MMSVISDITSVDSQSARETLQWLSPGNDQRLRHPSAYNHFPNSGFPATEHELRVDFPKANALKIAHSVIALLVLLSLAVVANAAEDCPYLNAGGRLPGYDTGGPYKPDYFKMDRDRTNLREFLWTHWKGHTKGIARVRVSTVDEGAITELYVVQPDTKGRWGIDVERDNPYSWNLQAKPYPPCWDWHVDSLVRISIGNPRQASDPDFPDGKIPEKMRLADSDVREAKDYLVVLLINEDIRGIF